MIAALMLTCQMQQINPLMGTDEGPAVQASIQITESAATVSGMPGLDIRAPLSAKKKGEMT
jgi:uncharacterized ParB-like nuclease family protein